MKVLTINAKSAVIVTLLIVAIITTGIFFLFGGDAEREEIPEVEIVLP